MNTEADNAHDLNGNTNPQPVEAVLPTKPKEWPDWMTAIIVGAAAGIVGVLLAIWVPALYVDGQANAQHPGAGAGATLGALFLGTPLAFGLGPIVGIIGGLIGAWLGRWFGRKSPLLIWFLGGIVGLFAGVVAGVIVLLLFVGKVGY